MAHRFLVPALTLTMEKTSAISRFDSSATMFGRYVNFVRIARANGVSWKSIIDIGYHLCKQRGFKF